MSECVCRPPPPGSTAEDVAVYRNRLSHADRREGGRYTRQHVCSVCGGAWAEDLNVRRSRIRPLAWRVPARPPVSAPAVNPLDGERIDEFAANISSESQPPLEEMIPVREVEVILPPAVDSDQQQ